MSGLSIRSRGDLPGALTRGALGTALLLLGVSVAGALAAFPQAFQAARTLWAPRRTGAVNELRLAAAGGEVDLTGLWNDRGERLDLADAEFLGGARFEQKPGAFPRVRVPDGGAYHHAVRSEDRVELQVQCPAGPGTARVEWKSETRTLDFCSSATSGFSAIVALPGAAARPPVPAFLGFPLLAGAVYTLARLRLDRALALSIVVAGVAVIAASLRRGALDPSVVTWLAAGAGVLLAGLRLRGKDPNRSRAAWWAVASLALLALGRQWAGIPAAGIVGIDTDAVAYRTFGEQMDLFSPRGFYSGQFRFREPLWLLVLHVSFRLLGSSFLILALTSALFAVALVPATFVLGRGLAGASAGLGAAALVAVDPAWIRQGPRGLREPLYTLLWVVFCIACFGVRDRPAFGGVRRAIACGVLFGLTLLTRPNAPSTFGVVMVMVVLSLIADRKGSTPAPVRWTVGMAAVTLAVAVALWLPHAVGQWRSYGDPFYSAKFYGRLNANLEFRDRLGTPGFPTLAEFEQKTASGPPLTMAGYLFGLHSPAELLAGTASGLFRALLDAAAGLPFLWAYLLALPWLAWNPRTRPLSAALLLPPFFPTAFLYSRHPFGITERYRNIVEMEPMAAVALSCALALLWAHAKTRVGAGERRERARR